MFQRILPHLAAVAVFALLTVFYFLPYYQGQTLEQHDVVQWTAMSKELKDWNDQHPGDPAMWASRNFSGMPAVTISMVYPQNWSAKVLPIFTNIFPDSSSILFLLFAGFYIMLLCFGVNPWLSMAGALAYGVSSFALISIEAGHNTKVQTMAMMAPVIGGVVLAYRGKILQGAALAALFLSLSIASNHQQITYYTGMMVLVLGLYFLVESVLQKTYVQFAKASGALIVAAVLALLPNVVGLWDTLDYTNETMRGGKSELAQKEEQAKGGGLDIEYATRWSYGLTDGEIVSLFVPNVKGGASGANLGTESITYAKMTQRGVPAQNAAQFVSRAPMYWGGQPFTSGPVYFGAAVMFLFIFSFFVVKSNIKWAALVLFVFSCLLAAGHNTPFFKIIFDTLPFFNKFRNPSMALAIAEVICPLMALLALHELITNGTWDKAMKRNLFISAGIAAGVVIVFGLLRSFGSGFSGESDKQFDASYGWLIEALQEDRAALLRSDSLRSLFFIAATFGLLWFFMQKTFSRTVFIAAIAVLFLADGWMVGKRYLNDEDFVEQQGLEQNFAPSQADLDILKDSDPNFRVYNTTRDAFNDAITAYYHKNVGGYSPAKMIRYQDMIERHISKGHMPVFNMLNTKYFIVKGPNEQPMMQRNPGALGNAWFVNEVKWAKNADEEIDALTEFNPRTTAVVDERFKTKVGSDALVTDSSATITETLFSPNKLTYESNSSSNGLAVFSEMYYNDEKGWHAFIDGKPVEQLRVNYILRALMVPAGKHNIEFRFEPRALATGGKISMVGSILLFLFVLGVFGYSFYQWQQRVAAEPQATAPTPKAKKK